MYGYVRFGYHGNSAENDVAHLVPSRNYYHRFWMWIGLTSMEKNNLGHLY